jgi:hypothetical protein
MCVCVNVCVRIQGLQGLVWSADLTQVSPPPGPLDLTSPGAMAIPLFWTTLHDALVATAPAAGSSSKAAAVLARRVAGAMGGLRLKGCVAECMHMHTHSPRPHSSRIWYSYAVDG